VAKSVGNIQVLDRLLERHPGEVIRLALLMTHYRQPLDWNEAILAEARAVLEGWRFALKSAQADSAPPDAVMDALGNDLNTPQAIAEMHRLAKGGDAGGLRAAGHLLGLLEPRQGEWIEIPSIASEAADWIEARLRSREEARARKDFTRADTLRDELLSLGVEISDGPQGTEWRATPRIRIKELERMAWRKGA